MKKLLIMIPFVAGFFLASFWDGGREFVVEHTPFAKDTLKSVSSEILDKADQAKDITKEILNK
jgi:hypothetical protein